jgi:hypothetical protein
MTVECTSRKKNWGRFAYEKKKFADEQLSMLTNLRAPKERIPKN